MGVVTEQPGAGQDQPPSYSNPQPSAGLPLSPGYGGAYGQQPSGPAPPQGTAPWMPVPTNISVHCPPGLEYLTAVDQMVVEQQVELLEALVDIECTNKYRIVNSLNQQVYFATEESEFCQRIWCKSGRGFNMRIWDNVGREVMRILRPFQCLAGCAMCADKACCSLYIEVEAPVGQVIGRVRQTKSCMAGHFDVMSPDEDVLLKIRGPTCVFDGPCCTANQDFLIFPPDLSNEIGKISKKYGGFVKEMFTKAEIFGMNFPMDLDVKMKATLFGALFLIDFMYFERSQE